MDFLFPEAFWGLLVNFAWLAWQMRSAARRKHIAQHFQQAIPKQGLKPVFAHLAWLGLIVALAQPVSHPRPLENASTERKENFEEGEKTAQVSQVAHDVIFLVDTSASMQVCDTRTGESRLELAKDIIEETVAALSGQQVALYAFTSKLTCVCPLTHDYLYLRLLLRRVQLNMGDVAGTDYLEALDQLQRKHWSLPTKSLKTVVLLSDGGDTYLESQEGEKRQVAFSAILGRLNESEKANVRFFTVGLGSKQGEVLPGIAFNGKPVRSTLDEELLQALANKGGGSYFFAADASSLALSQTLLAQLAVGEEQMSTREVKTGTLQRESVADSPQKTERDVYYQLPLGFSLLCLLPFARRRALGLGLALLASPAFAFEAVTELAKAEDSLARCKSEQETAVCLFNVGALSYELKDFNKAAESFGKCSLPKAKSRLVASLMAKAETLGAKEAVDTLVQAQLVCKDLEEEDEDLKASCRNALAVARKHLLEEQLGQMDVKAAEQAMSAENAAAFKCDPALYPILAKQLKDSPQQQRFAELTKDNPLATYASSERLKALDAMREGSESLAKERLLMQGAYLDVLGAECDKSDPTEGLLQKASQYAKQYPQADFEMRHLVAAILEQFSKEAKVDAPSWEAIATDLRKPETLSADALFAIRELKKETSQVFTELLKELNNKQLVCLQERLKLRPAGADVLEPLQKGDIEAAFFAHDKTACLIAVSQNALTMEKLASDELSHIGDLAARAEATDFLELHKVAVSRLDDPKLTPLFAGKEAKQYLSRAIAKLQKADAVQEAIREQEYALEVCQKASSSWSEPLKRYCQQDQEFVSMHLQSLCESTDKQKEALAEASKVSEMLKEQQPKWEAVFASQKRVLELLRDEEKDDKQQDDKQQNGEEPPPAAATASPESYQLLQQMEQEDARDTEKVNGLIQEGLRPW